MQGGSIHEQHPDHLISWIFTTVLTGTGTLSIIGQVLVRQADQLSMRLEDVSVSTWQTEVEIHQWKARQGRCSAADAGRLYQ